MVVYLCLLQVAKVAETERGERSEVDVRHDLVAHVGCGDEGGGHDVVVVVATGENLVVGLSVVGTEHDTHER